MRVSDPSFLLVNLALMWEAGRLRIRAQNVVNLEGALTKYGVISGVGHNCVSFLSSMLRLKLSDRATAAELLCHKWLN
jgi:serine/threonine-protein kinase SRPK3